MTPGIRWLVLALALVLQGCLLDIAPPREPLDAIWQARMLAGEYERWVDGEKSTYVGPDEIRAGPAEASGTRYGIVIIEQSTLGGGGWWIVGGMVARAARQTERDRSFEFFLVVRSTTAGRGRLVKQWRFPYEELGRTVPPKLVENLRARYSGAELQKELEQSKIVFIEGFLSFDESSKTATVTITGLIRPFQERVDLSRELP
ncbi:MAG: hypothetical protein HYU26_17520 [Candidatus Rokubacteria bacterium]|nr:hypothetical protein [Candidatus Rokubacteria bacterium]